MENTGPLLTVIVITFIIFFALREVMLWYFKINTQVKLLKSIIMLLSKDKELSESEKKFINDSMK
jgi:uncharacterized protein YqfA (UPF0365 family)